MTAPILMYHRIGTPRAGSIVSGQYVSPELFEKQLRFLKRRYAAMFLSDFVAALGATDSGVRPLAITFDDGYASVNEQALPILTRYAMPSTVFVVAGQIGETNAWDEAKGDVTERIMTADQLREADREGIEVGSHTCSHRDLVDCDESQLEAEISGSRRILQAIVGKDIGWFSYPYGRESEQIRSLVRSAGYLGACGTKRSLNTSRTDRYSLARINIRASTSVPWLMYKLYRARRGS